MINLCFTLASSSKHFKTMVLLLSIIAGIHFEIGFCLLTVGSFFAFIPVFMLFFRNVVVVDPWKHLICIGLLFLLMTLYVFDE